MSEKSQAIAIMKHSNCNRCTACSSDQGGMDSVLRRFGLKKSDQRDGRQGAPKDVFGFSQVCNT